MMGPGARLLRMLLRRKKGDMSTYIQSRQFFPAVWTRINVPANADVQLGLTGTGQIKELPAARKTDVVTLVLVLTAVPGVGTVTATVTKDGVDTAYYARCGAPTSTQRRVVEIPPGALAFNKEHRIGIHLTSSATLSPTTIDAAVYVEVQPTP